MTTEPSAPVADSFTLRFTGRDEEGESLHELRAADVADVLEGLVGLTSDFDRAGAFDVDGPAGSEIRVRPAREGSFIIDVVRVVTEVAPHVESVMNVTGIPTIGTLIWLATKSARADVKDATRIEGTNLVKITWQDDTIDEVPLAVWEELKVRKRRRKKHLRQLMAPLSDERVSALEVAPTSEADGGESGVLTLRRSDYDAVKPEDEIEESQDIFEVEAQISALDFEDASRWKVKTVDVTRGASIEDQAFLKRLADGLAIRKDDIFRLQIREDRTIANGYTRSTWTVIEVLSHRRTAGDNDS